MEMEKDNANPTILNTSQLPTRHNAGKNATTDKLSDQFSQSIYNLSKPFFDALCLDNLDDVLDDIDASDGFTVEPIDEQEIFDLISTISDPEHPLSLGQLAVVNLPDIHISPSPSSSADPNTLTRVLVKITPTITHCSLATVIGLGIRVRLEKALPPNYRIDVMIKEGTHSQDDQVNKQLADKERVAAAMENDTLKGVIDRMLVTCV
ncbi:hypothetical protein SLS62_001335 [Diatrype stigma]|uniref:MIP18 family-like domain-containing protein n=1 Tax=Diatrype stigma TaxID=117547 RepID=A0AAN9YTE7_9PEZI